MNFLDSSFIIVGRHNFRSGVQNEESSSYQRHIEPCNLRLIRNLHGCFEERDSVNHRKMRSDELLRFYDDEQSNVVEKNKGNSRDMVDEILNQTCPNVDLIRKVRSCLTSNNKTDMPSGREMSPWMELCGKKKNCSISLTADCQKKLRGINNVLCQCTKHELTNQRRKYWQEQWRKCGKVGNNVSASSKPKGAANGREAYGQSPLLPKQQSILEKARYD
uniref:GDNF/GAS1 domain-containing protein n=1 Tax=Romanomermis culicivorax TaxID=13658 RepID=A0A915K9T0_ROMCU